MKVKYSNQKGVVIFFLAIVLVVCLNSEKVQVTSQDSKYLRLFLNNWHLSTSPELIHKNFDSELNFISTMQDSIIAQIKHSEISHSYFGDVSFYYNNHQGYCYDRAALIEKILSYYHFPFRHVYVYFGDNDKKPGPFSIFKKNLSSHALVEVKTVKGWMVIGTNSNWLGIDTAGNVLSIGEVRKQLQLNNFILRKKQLIGYHPFWTESKNFRFIYGLYSRHGDFFSHKNQNTVISSMRPSFHILPDYDLKMLFYNFAN